MTSNKLTKATTKRKNDMANMGLKEELKEEVLDLDKRMDEQRKVTDGSRLGLVDLVTEKVMSRKLLVWVTTTVLLACGLITSEHWAGISLGYVGIEGFGDLATRWRHGPPSK